METINLYPHQEEALELTKDSNRVAYFYDMGLSGRRSSDQRR